MQDASETAAGSCDRPRALRPIAPPPPVPRGRTCTARIAPTCTVLPPYAREVGLSSYFVTAFGLHRAACARPGLCISRVPPAHPRLSRLTRTRLHLSDRANVHRAAAPIGGAARCRPTLVTATASDTPYAQLGLCATRVPPARPRRCSACACASGHAPICRRCLIPLRRPDRSPSAIFCPHIARVAKPVGYTPISAVRRRLYVPIHGFFCPPLGAKKSCGGMYIRLYKLPP